MNNGGNGSWVMMSRQLSAGVEAGFFAQVDICFAEFVLHLCRDADPSVVIAAALVSRHTREGHICLNLSEYAGDRIVLSRQPMITLECPGLDAWTAYLGACDAVGTPADNSPMVLDATRLYLRRYWDYEQTCAEKLLRLNTEEKPFDTSLFRNSMDAIFPLEDDDGAVRQKLCALTALRSGLCVVTGGPGTGKTTLVSKILSLLLQQDHSLRIALAAPTGKAARRVGEAVSETARHFDLPDEIKALLPGGASTIHRLLGMMPTRPNPRYNRENLLPYDVVVVDEASMVDLSLMAKLLDALKPSARLILLGDRNQLASVQAGHVLGDICDTGSIHGYSPGFIHAARDLMGIELAAGAGNSMQDSVVELEKTYRFAPDSGIYSLSMSVNGGDVPACMDIIESGGYCDIRVHEAASGDSTLKKTVLDAYTPYLKADSPEECLRLFDSFRILCALRDGPFGVVRMNSLAEGILAAHGLIKPSGLGLHYHGRPVLITANDYTLRLFNGDVGVELFDRDEQGLRVFFPTPDGVPRKVSPLRLPEHETAFAMTVHKSQGSEFDHVVLMLPDRDSPVLSRELVYTGITRAMKSIDIFLERTVFAQAVTRRTQRTSGLHSLLWKRQEIPGEDRG